MNIKKLLKSRIKEEHKGFLMTLEVLVTLVIMFSFVTMDLYILRVMNIQRFMNTVLTSTAEQASRWGGINSQPYKDNVNGSESLVDVAQKQLTLVAKEYNPKVTGSPNYISKNSDKINISISYSLPSAFSTYSKVNPNGDDAYNMYEKTSNMNLSVSVNSIMKAGKLLKWRE